MTQSKSFKDILKEGFGVIVFNYDDGSQVKILTTANPEMLAMYGIPEGSGFYDLETMKEAPRELFKTTKVTFENTDSITYKSKLDEMVSKGVKLCW